ncbi:hypothetical protein ACOCEA_13735 [Maribacter sp. CXY002]|uniref:hypothetical protein n=1 Tax=Maribacter luteocoastalis TaxID=3407671 RepID=UPI003B68189B
MMGRSLSFLSNGLDLFPETRPILKELDIITLGVSKLSKDINWKNDVDQFNTPLW